MMRIPIAPAPRCCERRFRALALGQIDCKRDALIGASGQQRSGHQRGDPAAVAVDMVGFEGRGIVLPGKDSGERRPV